MKSGIYFDTEDTANAIRDAHSDFVVLLVDYVERSERMRVIVNPVPRVKSVLDDITTLTRSLHSHHGAERLRNRRAHRYHWTVSRFLAIAWQAGPHQDTVVMDGESVPRSVFLMSKFKRVPGTYDSTVANTTVMQAGAKMGALVRTDAELVLVSPDDQVTPGNLDATWSLADRIGGVDDIPPAARSRLRDRESLPYPARACLAPVGDNTRPGCLGKWTTDLDEATMSIQVWHDVKRQ